MSGSRPSSRRGTCFPVGPAAAVLADPGLPHRGSFQGTQRPGMGCRSWVLGAAAAVNDALACGRTGVAVIGQLADVDRSGPPRREKIRGVPAGRTEDAGHASGVSLRLCGRAAGSRSPQWVITLLAARPAYGPVPFPGCLSPLPNRLGGELGAGGDVKLGEHVREMGLHGPAGDVQARGTKRCRGLPLSSTDAG